VLDISGRPGCCAHRLGQGSAGRLRARGAGGGGVTTIVSNGRFPGPHAVTGVEIQELVCTVMKYGRVIGIVPDLDSPDNGEIDASDAKRLE